MLRSSEEKQNHAVRRRKALIGLCALALTAAILALHVRKQSEEAFVESLNPRAFWPYPADPRNGGFTETLFDFPDGRHEEILQALIRHFKGRKDCIEETGDVDVSWHNAADTWRVTFTREQVSPFNPQIVGRVDVIRKSTWIETTLFRLFGRQRR
jgi:hypothetical protein